MKKTWKKAGAAVLVAGLTISGASYVWADEKAREPIDLSQLKEEASDKVSTDTQEEVTTPDTTEEPKNDDTAKEIETSKDSATIELPKIPEGYDAGNLAALAKAYEKVQNPTAKAAILRNMERAIAKWEAKQGIPVPPAQPVFVEQTPEKPTEEEPANEERKDVKSQREMLKVEHKVKWEALKTEHKTERETLKAEWKAEKSEWKVGNGHHKVEQKKEKEQQKAERKQWQEQKKSEKKDSNHNNH